ncbi:tetratricopeptide repeat protein [Micromonospora sp. DR5-3]|uniref:tetratricopeptide repeat protein n=1 Tax=unclassified Micromonospora TaxID=2617518 RepID=UPI0011D62F96|nr:MULTISPECIES: tetratricopeptide repeat protein [unclassified Micromonospora]MCW3815257.1 tetratricopeptide repeat protein [Micromonospora sp. DR5-3]TYC22645.1 tetratricopeptide repeat protein [Micromonospora sp. MP36]
MTDTGLAVQERAQALSQIGRHAEAAQLLREALAGQPEHVGLLLQLARCHRELGQLAEANRLVDRALGLSKAPQHLYAEKARIFLAADEPGFAAAAAQHALELAPRSWEHHGLLAESLLRMGNPNRVLAARRHADTALELAPDNPQLHVLDARLHARMGRLRAAREACGRALAVDPAYEPALRELARFDAGQDRTSAAARGFGDALAANPRAAWNVTAHEVVSLALGWRLFDVTALAALAYWSVFALVDPAPGGVRPVAAGMVLMGLAGATGYVWRRQPDPVRQQLRRWARAAAAVPGLLLVLAALASLVLGGLAPAADSPAAGVAALLLLPVAAVLAFRLWRQLRRRSSVAIRRLGYAAWARLTARRTAAGS